MSHDLVMESSPVKIVQLKNERFVKDWQYSQGCFDMVETDDACAAKDFTGSEDNFETYFRKSGARLVEGRKSFEECE